MKKNSQLENVLQRSEEIILTNKNDTLVLENKLREIITNNNLTFLILVDSQGNIMASGGKSTTGNKLNDRELLEALDSNTKTLGYMDILD